MAQLVKNLPAMQETGVQSLGWQDTLEKGKVTHSSILAWRSPWGHKESDKTEQLSLEEINESLAGSTSYLYQSTEVLECLMTELHGLIHTARNAQPI